MKQTLALIYTSSALQHTYFSAKAELRKCEAISLTTLGHPLYRPTASFVID